VIGDLNPRLTDALVILNQRRRVKELSSTFDAVSPAGKTSHFAFHPPTKTIRRKFFAIQRFAVAFQSALA
jgi:hypothetical protein